MAKRAAGINSREEPRRPLMQFQSSSRFDSRIVAGSRERTPPLSRPRSIPPCFAVALSLLVLIVSSCATPVGVKHVDEQTAYRALGANVMSSGEPSAYSTQLLERNALVKRYRQNPEQ